MPPGVTTWSAVRLAAQERADMVNSSFISSAEWLRYGNASYAELYGLLVQKFGNDYFVTSTSWTTSGSSQTLALPNDFFKLLGVDLLISGSDYVTLEQLPFAERNRYSLPNAQTPLGATNLRYRLQGGNLFLAPQPAGGQTVRAWYVPRLTELTADGDTLDLVNGWGEYVVVDMAIRAKDKEESDVSVLMAQKAALVERINTEAESRDATGYGVTADVRGDGFGHSGPWGY